MASVSLAPRTWREWFQAYHFFSETDSSKMLNLCSEMETTVGQLAVPEDKGEIGALIAKCLSFTEDVDDARDGVYKRVMRGSEQNFATAYREFETRFTKLLKQEIELNNYLRKGSSEVQNDSNYRTIKNKTDYLEGRITEIRREKHELSLMFDMLKFAAYNKIFKAAANLIISRINSMGNYFKTTPKQTLALGIFTAITSYSIYTNTHSSFLIKALTPLFFMYIGAILNNSYYKLTEQPAQSHTVSFTITPPGSPIR